MNILKFAGSSMESVQIENFSHRNITKSRYGGSKRSSLY